MFSSVERPLILGQRPSLASIALAGVLVGVLYVVGKAIYNVYFHPLSRYPGPKLWAATRIPYGLEILGGHPHKTLVKLHEEYGDVIRVAPDELSFRHDDGFKELMGHRKGGRGEHGKDKPFFGEQAHALLASDREDHARQRRILAHGFSAQSMAAQQPLIKEYVDLLMQRLHEHSEGGTKPLDMVAWYNWTTFDIIGDLTFGEPFGCLRESAYHPWVHLLFEFMKTKAINSVLIRWPTLLRITNMFVPADLRRKAEDHLLLTKKKTASRIALGSPRPDFMEGMINAGDVSVSACSTCDWRTDESVEYFQGRD